MSRKASFDILFGTNGTGKTTVLKKLIAVNERNLVIPANRLDTAWLDFPEIKTRDILKKVTKGEEDDLDYFFKSKKDKDILLQREFLRLLSKELQTFRGTRRINIDHPRIFDLVINLEKGFLNGGLFIDDFKNHIRSNNLSGNVVSLFGDRRHRMLDIFMAAHSPTDMPPKLLDFEPNIYLFRTTSNFDRADEKYHGEVMNKLEEAQARVNNIAKTKNPYYFEIIKF
jgi:hypothetical protein